MANEAYKLYKSNPAHGFISIPYDTTTGGKGSGVSSLTFIGPSAPSFGPSVNQDFLYLLENFANNTMPENPIKGQLWYDTSNLASTGSTGNKLKVWSGAGTKFSPINGIWQHAGKPS